MLAILRSQSLVIYRSLKKVYKVEGFLGEGSFASVYKLTEISSGHSFAGKSYSLDKLNASSSRRTALRNELEVIKSLDHPGIPQFVDLYQAGGEVIIITEEVPQAVDLRQFWMQWRSHPSFGSWAINIIVQLLKILGHLFQKKVLHKDIKPENILLSRNGDRNKSGSIMEWKVSLIDFGFSCFLNSKSESKLAGTRGFMAPELFGGLDS